MLQQQQFASQLQQQSLNSNSKQRIDPDKIYPKRLGTYQNGNALVLQYYNLVLDKFKKHVIPLDRGKSIKQNVDEIYKNPKHFILLKKVQPKYIQGVMRGQSFLSQMSPAPYMSTSNNNNNYNISQHSQSSYPNSINSYSQQQSPSYTNQQQQPSYTSSSQYNNNQSSSYNYNNHQQTDQTTMNNNNNNSISQIIKNGAGSGMALSKQAQEKIQQVEEYYDEEFEEFQISQSMGKKSGIKNAVANRNINNNPDKIAVQTNHNTKQKVIQQLQQKQQKKQKKSKKSKQGKKKSKKKKQPQPQQDQFQFDFLDDDGRAPKNTTIKKKQSSKQKDKQKPKKEKDKEKSSIKNDKKPKNQPIKTQQKPKPIQQLIEEDFDFDL